MHTTGTVGLNDAVASVKDKADVFALLPSQDKAGLLNACAERIPRYAEMWTSAACVAKRIDPDSNTAAEEWLGGPVVAVRYARLLAKSVMEVAKDDVPVLGCKLTGYAPDGLDVEVFPYGLHDSLALSGYSASVRFPRGTNEQDIIGSQASQLRKPGSQRPRKLCVVLGAGNVASIPFADVLSKMFIEGYVVVLKLNPVNEWVGPSLEKMLEPLIAPGFLKIVTGGADVGAFLCEHPDVDAIHVTGAGSTQERIVWGATEEERTRRKNANDPVTGSRVITSELGNVSPVLIVPGAYSNKELATMAWNIASMKANNSGFNCNAAQVIVTAEGWQQRMEFLDLLAYAFADVRTRYAYYPGACDRYTQMIQGYPRGMTIGGGSIAEGYLPWTIIHSLDSGSYTEPLFTTEAFCPILAETSVEGEDAEEFLSKAVTFANMRLPGTLNATLMTPPSLERDRDGSALVECAIQDLRYGTVSVNVWPGVSFGLGTTPWGAAPGGTLKNPESGIGWVHNSFLLEGMEKTILRGPLVPSPKPPWFVNNGNSLAVAKKLLTFERSPSLGKLPGLALAALRG